VQQCFVSLAPLRQASFTLLRADIEGAMEECLGLVEQEAD